MTLEEAIIHCKEKACGNTQCALEHRQLAEWLKELQSLRSYKNNSIEGVRKSNGGIVMKRDSQINLVKQHYQNALHASIMLSNSLQLLSIAASRLYGEELDAQICAGGEIEFRTVDNPDGLNGMALRIEDILEINE